MNTYRYSKYGIRWNLGRHLEDLDFGHHLALSTETLNQAQEKLGRLSKHNLENVKKRFNANTKDDDCFKINEMGVNDFKSFDSQQRYNLVTPNANSSSITYFLLQHYGAYDKLISVSQDTYRAYDKEEALNARRQLLIIKDPEGAFSPVSAKVFKESDDG